MSEPIPSILAHDLRNPLAAIHLGLETLRLFPPEDPAYKEALRTVGEQVELLTRLVDGLQDGAGGAGTTGRTGAPGGPAASRPDAPRSPGDGGSDPIPELPG